MSDFTWLYRQQASLSPPSGVHCNVIEPRRPWRQQQHQYHQMQTQTQQTHRAPSSAAARGGGHNTCFPQSPPWFRPQHRHLLLRLRRPSMNVPWGLTLCRPRDDAGGGNAAVVVVGDARPAAVRAALVESREQWGDAMGPGPFMSAAGGGEGTASAARAYVRRWNALLRRQPPVTAAVAPLLPGDWILAINGRCPWALASSLPELTTHLRGRRELCLLVFRHDAASSAAAQELRQAREDDVGTLLTVVTVKTGAPTPACRAADASYRVIRTLFPQAVPPAAVTPSPPPPLTPKGVFSPFSPSMGLMRHQRFEEPFSDGRPAARSVAHRNPLFTDAAGNPIAFDDDGHQEWDIEVTEVTIQWSDRLENINAESGDGIARPPVSRDEFVRWLRQRKQSWQERRRDAVTVAPDDAFVARGDGGVAVDFWSSQGDATFDDWLVRSKRRWRWSYSWNRRKRRRLEEELEQKIALHDGNFDEWLRVRKNQWLIQRRKRHRRLLESVLSESASEVAPSLGTTDVLASHVDCTVLMGRMNPDVAIVDAILEEQEKRQAALHSRDPMDLGVFFDRKLGLPDDIVAHTIRFLQPKERPHLLAISRTMRKELCDRQEVWRQLCESHWKVPRRPRKSWHEIYFDSHRFEVERARIKVDALLTRAADILFKADNLQAIEKLVTTAERNDAFDVNYSSGVVCERNSILNLAVIHQRHKVVRWLVESKHADIETCDRGQFTPLMNAAWAGDRYLVRFFMQKGADRWKLGTSHYTKPLAAPDFRGLDAAGWAENRGHPGIAKLIRMGL